MSTSLVTRAKCEFSNVRKRYERKRVCERGNRFLQESVRMQRYERKRVCERDNRILQESLRMKCYSATENIASRHCL